MIALILSALLQGGPFNDEVWTATSKDGLAWTVGSAAVASRASVPGVVEGKDGTLRIYFVDFSGRPDPGEEALSVIESDDGKDWSKSTRVSVKDKPNKGAAVDPSVVLLDDGRFRLFYFGSEMTRGDPASAKGPRRIYSAISSDGVAFENEEGVRFEHERITDPDVVKVGDAWWMFLSAGQETLTARSDDGLKFEKVDRTFKGGVPGALAVDGGVRVFTCRDGIVSWRWDLKGEPREEGKAIERGKGYKIAADPCALRRGDGTYFMVFKRAK
ncbi:MAG: hypothetical protein A3F84_19655 [Candidatus Handelsmanbacteria bacterium RIFCSPLOWO2_12_FULL_64_10]|uniref:Sialidase domain-containing protein n=1 Tax=Handelsmanbacteria sp. (strain RIFCSPLOWO2_12_FULL_64_10) TaxID=1817868 RepID=A0A1F6CAL0_HANXR|nr:MAG: hypothetical protein A3F84_19655 [Candidatus Handelsmanbacteria bacterium RIFCSPLOWO2_12_FULL_64_10]